MRRFYTQRVEGTSKLGYLFCVLTGNPWAGSGSSSGALESCAISMLFFHYRGLMKIYMDIEFRSFRELDINLSSCTSSHQSIRLLKFADDTTFIGLISGGESAYRWETDHLVTWCSQNNLELSALKTVEMTVDYRKNAAPPVPIILCVRVCEVQPAKGHSGAITESILTSSITIWYTAATTQGQNAVYHSLYRE
ncbi:hypothetical protein L3Q82_020861, partial [Scortum barcoo]